MGGVGRQFLFGTNEENICTWATFTRCRTIFGPVSRSQGKTITVRKYRRLVVQSSVWTDRKYWTVPYVRSAPSNIQPVDNSSDAVWVLSAVKMYAPGAKRAKAFAFNTKRGKIYLPSAEHGKVYALPAERKKIYSPCAKRGKIYAMSAEHWEIYAMSTERVPNENMHPVPNARKHSHSISNVRKCMHGLPSVGKYVHCLPSAENYVHCLPSAGKYIHRVSDENMLQVTPSANCRKAFEPSTKITKARENICARYDVWESMHAVI